MGATHEYDFIAESDEKDEISQTRQRPRPVPVVTSWWKFILSNVLAACVGATIMFLVARSTITTAPFTKPAASTATSAAASIAPTSTSSALHVIPTNAITHVEGSVIESDLQGIILDCGHSPEEARAKGCIYDVMMQDWVPEPCYDAILTERYLAQGNYTWYSTGDGTTIMSDEEMAKGEHGSAFMSNSYHKAHCVFSWLKIVRALRNGWGISQELLSYDHVLHCAHGALKASSDDRVLGVSAPTNYAKCAVYETWKLDFIPDEHDSTA